MTTKVTSAATAVRISDAVYHIPRWRINLPHGLSCSGTRVAKAEISHLSICRSVFEQLLGQEHNTSISPDTLLSAL